MRASFRTGNDRIDIKELRIGYGIIVCRLQKALETMYNDQVSESIEQIKKTQLFASQKFYEELEKESVEEGWSLMKECSKGVV